MKGNAKTAFLLIGCVPVVWLALLVAPYYSEGILGIINSLNEVIAHPFTIEICENSLRTVLIFLLMYALTVGIILSSQHNYRKGIEYGSAKWGDVRAVNGKYADRKSAENKIMTQNVRISLNSRRHGRNLLTVVVGGSGAGKTRSYAKPNIMQANTSFVVLDPKGELLRDTGNLLKEKGYDIKVLDLLNPEKSHCYNPFVYLKTDNDVQKLVTNLFKATTPKGSTSNEPFWDTAASMLLLALIFYL
ncbi:MAG: type IV secretory system conjugative DNA transfer family protein, partial [Eubacteriaceae bacterium]|nr:type IV secretory system conjugative DNA transfer family protein [Eubacteriaceae bacterium]